MVVPAGTASATTAPVTRGIIGVDIRRGIAVIGRFSAFSEFNFASSEANFAFLVFISAFSEIDSKVRAQITGVVVFVFSLALLDSPRWALAFILAFSERFSAGIAFIFVDIAFIFAGTEISVAGIEISVAGTERVSKSRAQSRGLVLVCSLAYIERAYSGRGLEIV